MTLDDLLEEFRNHPTTRLGIRAVVRALRDEMETVMGKCLDCSASGVHDHLDDVFNEILGSDAGAEVLQGLKVGAFVAVQFTRPRNIQHHRLYWALCSHIAQAIGASRENVSDVLKLRTGHFTVVQTKTERVRLPRSISFAKMDQGEFRTFFEECVRVVVEEFLPGQKPSALIREIEQMVGIEQLATER